MKIDADAASEGGTLSQQDRVATGTDSTTPVKSTQTTPAAPPVPSISSLAALKQRKVWTTQCRILVISAIALLLFALAGLLIWLGRPNAADLLQKAADQGDSDAQTHLGQLYEKGEGVPKDLGKAAELYKKAADQGNEFAQFFLGWLYQKGEGVPKDLGKAAELWQKAADQGHVE